MLGLSSSLIKKAGMPLQWIKDGLKLYMPYRGSDLSKGTQFVGTGSTSFDGGDYITSPAINTTGDQTICFWFKSTDISAEKSILSMSDSGTGDGFVITHDSEIMASGNTASDAANQKETSALSSNRWYHIAVTKTTALISSIYVDGVDDTNSSSVNWTHYDETIIGGRNGSGSFIGNLKNIAIWNRVLTATEVQNVMYKSYVEVSGRLADNLVSWWAMDATSLGSELLGDADFSLTGDQATSTDSTYWGTESGWTISGGEAILTNSAGSGYDLVENAGGSDDNTAVATVVYQISYEITAVNGGSAKARIGDVDGATNSTVGTYTETITASNTNAFRMRSHGSWTGSINIKNLSVKEVNAEDLKGSNDGSIVGATVDTDLYGGDTPVIPRAIDNAPTVQADAIGAGSASLNGSNDGDEIICGNDSSLAIVGDMSVTAWINATNVTDTAGLIVKRDGGGTNYQFDLNTARKIRVYAGGDTVTSTTAVTLGEWTHIACTVDSGATDGAKTYINGVQDATTGDVTITSDDANLVLGHNEADGSNGHYGGYMSQVGLWRGILTQAEIQSVMEKDFEELTATDKSILTLRASDDCADDDTGDWSENGDDLLFDTDHYTFSASSTAKYMVRNGVTGYTVTSGNLYKMSVDVKDGTASSQTLGFGITDSGINHVAGVYTTAVTTSSFQTVTHYVTADANEEVDIYLDINTNPGGGNIQVKNFKLEEVTHDLVSYWALDETIESSGTGASFVYDKVDTSLGSELITASDNRDFTTFGNVNWAAGSGASVADGTNKAEITLDGSGSSEFALVNAYMGTRTTGKLYRFSFKLWQGTSSSTDWTIADGLTTIATGNFDGTEATVHSVYMVAASGASQILIKVTDSDGGIVYVDDCSFKEVQGNPGQLT